MLVYGQNYVGGNCMSWTWYTVRFKPIIFWPRSRSSFVVFSAHWPGVAMRSWYTSRSAVANSASPYVINAGLYVQLALEANLLGCVCSAHAGLPLANPREICVAARDYSNAVYCST